MSMEKGEQAPRSQMLPEELSMDFYKYWSVAITPLLTVRARYADTPSSVSIGLPLCAEASPVSQASVVWVPLGVLQ